MNVNRATKNRSAIVRGYQPMNVNRATKKQGHG